VNADWSPPDARGLRTRLLDPEGPRRISRRRLRRAAAVREPRPAEWPVEWASLLREWSCATGERSRWPTFSAIAGSARAGAARDLLDELLVRGLAEVEEQRQTDGSWHPYWVRLELPRRLRGDLGLPDRDALAEEGRMLRAQPLAIPEIESAAQCVETGTATGNRRLALLYSMDRWLVERRQGTRRDFAQYARGTTKGISSGEWQWLGTTFSLAEFGIEGHTPGLWLQAPLLLHLPDGVLDLRAASDMVALTPATTRRVISVEGTIRAWRLVENRTSFERAARRYGAQDAVVWLPGMAPLWWHEAMKPLVTAKPAGALIACDPDPAGIQIALNAAALWTQAGLEWAPWAMDGRRLEQMPQRQALSAWDDEVLARLAEVGLPPALAELAQWMREHREKGEQEAIEL